MLTLAAFLAWSLAAQLLSQAPTQAAGDSAFVAVAYVEVVPASKPAAVNALKRYSDRIRTGAGLPQVEIFEQVGRPGHLAVVETWRDRSAFDGRNTTAATELQMSLEPIRASGYDQRPYKTLSVAPAKPTPGKAVVVVSHVDVAPDPRVPPMLQRLAEASRQDRGNLRFDVLQHTMRANHFTVIEVWVSQSALDAHAAAPHTKQYRDELQPMTGSPLDERVYRAVH